MGQMQSLTMTALMLHMPKIMPLHGTISWKAFGTSVRCWLLCSIADLTGCMHSSLACTLSSPNRIVCILLSCASVCSLLAITRISCIKQWPVLAWASCANSKESTYILGIKCKHGTSSGESTLCGEEYSKVSQQTQSIADFWV